MRVITRPGPGAALTAPALLVTLTELWAGKNPIREISVANIKSQIKRNTTNEKRRLRNKAVKSELKTAVRSAREATASGDADAARSALETAARKLDKAASKGVIHKNQAANRKSALARRAAAL